MGPDEVSAATAMDGFSLPEPTILISYRNGSLSGSGWWVVADKHAGTAMVDGARDGAAQGTVGCS